MLELPGLSSREIIDGDLTLIDTLQKPIDLLHWEVHQQGPSGSLSVRGYEQDQLAAQRTGNR